MTTATIPGPVDLAPVIEKLTKDVKTAAVRLTPREARYLTDVYYNMQDQRIRADGQVRALEASNEPNTALVWLSGQAEALENRVRSLLDAYSDSQPVGRWTRSIVGIGPVIAAGLMAHIDITKAPTPGHIYAFAGLDPKQKWLGAKAGDLVREAFAAAPTSGQALTAIALVSGRRVFEICRLSDPTFEPPPPDQIARAIAEAAALDPAEVAHRMGTFIHPDNAIRTICAETGATEHSVYDALMPKIHLHKREIGDALKRRPWNATLKTLCWKLGESFTKTCNNEDSFYGPLYKQRKVWEQSNNEAGKLAEQAAEKLSKFKIGRDTDARLWYEGCLTVEAAKEIAATEPTKRLGLTKKLAGEPGSGTPMLPPAHIHARACRWTVKMFLANFWEVGYYCTYGKLPAFQPYPIAHLGHVHKIDPPNMAEVPGMLEASQAARKRTM